MISIFLFCKNSCKQQEFLLYFQKRNEAKKCIVMKF